MRKRGRDLFLLINGNLLAFAVNYRLTIGVEEIEVNNPVNGVWADADPGGNDWTLTADHVFSHNTFVEVFSLLNTTVTVTMQDRDEGNWSYVGSGFITNLSKSTPVDGMAAFNFTIKGKGQLSLATPPAGIGAMVIEGLPANVIE